MLINAGPPFKGEANNVMNGGSNSPLKGRQIFLNGAPLGEANNLRMVLPRGRAKPSLFLMHYAFQTLRKL